MPVDPVSQEAEAEDLEVETSLGLRETSLPPRLLGSSVCALYLASAEFWLCHFC